MLIKFELTQEKILESNLKKNLYLVMAAFRAYPLFLFGREREIKEIFEGLLKKETMWMLKEGEDRELNTGHFYKQKYLPFFKTFK